MSASGISANEHLAEERESHATDGSEADKCSTRFSSIDTWPLGSPTQHSHGHEQEHNQRNAEL
jgi:hypothetical protein